MKDLTPLFEASSSARTRALLQAGRADLPPAGFSDRLLVGLGLSVAISSVSVTAAAGTVSAAAASGAASTGSSAASLALVGAKWVVIGVIGGGILAGGADLAWSPSAKAPPPPGLPEMRGAPPPPAAVPTAPNQPAAPLRKPDQTAPSELAQPAVSSATTDDAASSRQGQLGREAQLIDRARRSLVSGHPDQALVELDAFARMTMTGVLDREAKVLRIDALYKAGQVNRARELAQEYLQAYPSDAHGARLRALEQDATSR